LLLAIVAAIALTLRERKDSKKIAVGDQVRVRRSDRVRLVKVEPVKPAAASSEQQEIAP
jgi:NADH-quinone oxidoreductase subunit J